MKNMRLIILLSLLIAAHSAFATGKRDTTGKRDISVEAGECAGLMMYAGDRVMAEVAFERTKNFNRTKFALKKTYNGLGVLTELAANKAKVFAVGRYLRSCKKVGINAAYLFKTNKSSSMLTRYTRPYIERKNVTVKTS
mgnify:CR=1 FL=1